MPRQIVVGNGRIAVALDDGMAIRDFFFPRVGLENQLAGHNLRIGVWVNGRFAWVDDRWEIKMMYLPETLVSRCLARNNSFQIELEINDAAHHFLNLFLRKVVVTNSSDSRKQVRLFFAHDWHIYGEETGDTAMYEPLLNAIVHYKRKRYFLMNGETDGGEGIYQYATGYKESLGKEGTWKDAEDGNLEGNPIAQGAVDSVISFKIEMPPRSTNTVYYWIACGRNLSEVKNLNAQVKKTGVEQMLLETENYWSAWVNKQVINMNVLPREISRLFKTSLVIMRSHVDGNGGIIASCDSDVLQFNRDTYSYIWPRDGAIVAMAFDEAGFSSVSQSFFQFCSRVISDEGFFSHKYSPDGSIGSSWHSLVDSEGKPQLPIQEDETALVLCALWRHFQKHREIEFIERVYRSLVVKATDFLLSYRDEKTGLPKPSFDMWEHRTGVFTSTASTVCAALNAAANFARMFYDSERQEALKQAANSMKEAMERQLFDRKLGRFLKAIYPDGTKDATVDSSLSFLFMSGTFDSKEEVVETTMNSVVDRLWVKTEVGGIARFENDEYHRVSTDLPGNPWLISTLWLGRWYIAKATSVKELDKGLNILRWAARNSARSGVLAEQLNPYTGAPVSVSPLVWSHAEFVLATCEYLRKSDEISSAANMTIEK